MPKLSNNKHELFAKNLVKQKFNATQAYLETYPDCSYESSRALASKLLTNDNIQARAIEIAESSKMTSLEGVIKSLKDDLTARKAMIVNGKIHYVRDNGAILSAKNLLINKVYGVGKDQGSYTDSRSIHLNVNNQGIQQMNSAVKEFRALQKERALRKKAKVDVLDSDGDEARRSNVDNKPIDGE